MNKVQDTKVPIGKFSILKNKLKASKKDYIFLEEVKKSPVIPSGKWGFDYVTGIGGAPIGRSIEFNGKEASGKTTLALAIAANAQKMGMHVLFLDYEHALDTVYAFSLGLNFDPEFLTIERPMSIEEGEEIFNMYMAMGSPILVIQDSLPAMIPQKFLDDPESRVKNPGLQSRMQSMFFNSAIRLLAKTGSTLISLNQMRSNFSMGKGPASAFAPVDKASGGYANKHFQSQIFNISAIGKEKEEVIDAFEGTKIKEDIYLKVRVTNKKNKVGKPYLGAVMYLEIGGTFDNIRNLINAAVQCKVIKKAGAHFSCAYFGEEVNLHGTKRLGKFLRENQEIVEKILRDIGWLKEDGTMDLSSTYSKYNANPLKDEDDDDDTVDEDDDDSEYEED